MKILVVEDEKYLLEEMMEWLTLEGYDAMGAPNGRLGLDLALQRAPDLILSDVMMPVMDGHRLLLELRTNPATALTPFVFLTARADRKDVRYGIELGADDYITKPFSRAELLGAIEVRRAKLETLRHAAVGNADHLRRALTRMLPHEIRTPLSSILGFGELLYEDGAGMTGPQVAEVAAAIVQAGRRLHKLTENYLLYAQIELSAADPRQQAISRQARTDGTASVISVVASVKAETYQRDDDLSLSVTDEVLTISNDDLAKILSEIVDNALKFSAKGSPVQVSSMCKDDEYLIQVSDQGRGMSEEQIQRIGAFVQFERALYEQQGAGLGLAIASRLAALYGGRVEIQSTPGAGTQITIALQLASNSVSVEGPV